MHDHQVRPKALARRMRLVAEWHRVLPAALILTSAVLANAAETAPPPAITAEAVSVREIRGADGRCYVSLKFAGDMLTNYSSVLGVRPLVVVDDAGTDLRSSNPAASEYWSTGGNVGFIPLRGWHQERPSQTRFGSVRLRATRRSAHVIKELRGELELYAPTIANGGVVVVDKFRAHPGAKINSPALARLGVHLIYHSKESFEAATKRADETGAREIWTAQKQRDESALFPGVLGNPEQSPQNYVVLKVSDPKKRLAGFGFCGADGLFIPAGNSSSVNDLLAYSFVPPTLPARLSLYVYVAAPGAVTRVPFQIDDIPLP